MNAALLNCPAPAKLNLFLHVTGRRADGYHTLQTAFRMLDYGDLLDFHLRKDGRLQRTNEVAGVPAEQDLVIRAARLLQEKTGTRLGADITVTKRIPMGGGLGGGSSDAATTLIALNRLWQTGVKRATLQAWALSLGADVPFFIFGRSAMAEGVGEALTPLSLPAACYVVIEPPVSVPTVEIFRAKDLTRDTPALIIDGSAVDDLLQTFQRRARNDLQPIACRLYPEVQHALDALSRFGAARMSGSGCCVFLECASRQQAENVVTALQSNHKIWHAIGLDDHPLRTWLDD
ncbi:4-(cytidine 5'-diphospho)-2-C-methyl-D-erythritol kinase [Uliginosibacterium gangwonense]|uniref:4-(cytidine 5'-diphospho)-2-C-methyl-D-erythritol kinase n=1 Tax=Uliginosibacterium gangwonense TaxID=392736 RepID=UPI000366A258|nr:4-(cytidine 5'-diphospho)-2-C-methyl-D-erythritol kinase [Uliginosibacterium gangwonense]